MAKRVWIDLKGNPLFWILSITSLVLLIISFFLPPKGEIHPSVVQAIAEIEGWGVLYIVLKAVDKGMKTSLTHGSTSVTIEDDDEEENS